MVGKLFTDSLQLSDSDKAILLELCDLLAKKYGNCIESLKLFRSRSRGEGSEFSDFDVLAVVDDDPWRRSEEMHDTVYPRGSENTEVILFIVWPYLSLRNTSGTTEKTDVSGQALSSQNFFCHISPSGEHIHVS
ncbi:MAG: hypothetical protein ACE5OR_11015 [bacterium]